MNDTDFYFTIEQEAVAEYKDRGSKFLAYAFAIGTADDFKKRLKALKEEHPKAAHHCFAYRIGLDGNTFRSVDDGEPAGSAGKPILAQLDSKNLTNTAVVVVRYFGGTLLGVPGLIQAYKTATSLALQLTPLLKKPVLLNYRLEFDYTLLNDVMLVVKRFGCTIVENETQLFCRLLIGIPKKEVEACTQKLADLHSVQVNAA